ncbi:MAG: hypothetical protein ACRDRG_00175 [Pseudonocardiaceae bacterium]
MEQATSPWEEWRPGYNPYRRTPFQILGLTPTAKGPGPVRNAIRQRRQRIQNAPERFALFGEQLDVAEVNEAEDRILNPETRLYAELCTHRPKLVSIDLRHVAGRLAEVLPPVPNPQGVLNAQRLARLVPAPVERTFPSLIELR